MLRYRDFFPMAADPQARVGQGTLSSTPAPLSDVLPLGILVTNREGKCLYSNAAYQKLCGWTGAELTGSHWSAVIHPLDHARALRHWNAAVLGHEPFLCEARLKCANGDVVWTRRNAALLTDRQPVHGYVHIVEDIGIYKAHQKARRRVEEQLFQEQERAQVTLDSIGDAVLSTDRDGLVSCMNRMAETLTGFTRDDAIGKPLSSVFQVLDATTLEPVADPARRAMASNRVVALEAHAMLRPKDGDTLAIEDSAAPIHNRNGAVIGAVIVFHDARFSQERTARMAHLAAHDELTGLHNRTAFYDRFEQSLSLARRHRTQMALLFIDLDNFKGINDLLGHDSGDAILMALAEKLRQCVRAADTVCRYGGDEFVVLLAEIAQPEHAQAVADKIRESAAAPIGIDGREVSLQLSIGVSVYPDDGESAEGLVKAADRAMYRIKMMNRPPETERPGSFPLSPYKHARGS